MILGRLSKWASALLGADMPAKSPEAIARKRANEKLYRIANAEKVKAMNKSYRENKTEEEKELKKRQMKEWRDKNLEHANTYSKEKRDTLHPSYLALKIGLPLAKIPPDLLAAKREQILLHREIKKLDKALK